MAYDFFLIERLHIGEDGHRRATRGPRGKGHALGGRPHPREQGVGPLALILLPVFFIFSKNNLLDFQVIPRTFVSAQK